MQLPIRFDWILILFAFCAAPALRGAEVKVIYPEFAPEIDGKEVDWIYGDYVMTNESITVVVAAPIATRDANLTVRQIGASILDISLNEPSNDQLSAYIPTRGNYLFHDPSQVETGRDEEGVFWKCRSSRTIAQDGTFATVTYRLRDGEPFLRVSVEIRGKDIRRVKAVDGVRADRTFKFSASGDLAICEDPFFRQCIGFTGAGIKWVNGRPAELHHQPTQQSDEQLMWETRIYPATSKLDLLGARDGAEMCSFQVDDQLPIFGGESMTRAKIRVASPNREPFELQTDDQGLAFARLPAGTYEVQASAIGFQSVPTQLPIEGATSAELKLTDGGGLIATIVDGEGDVDSSQGNDLSHRGGTGRCESWPRQHPNLHQELRLLGPRLVSLPARSGRVRNRF